MKIMASGPITLWQIEGEKVEDFLFLGSKITVDGDCCKEIKRHLLFGRKVMTSLDSILKSETSLCLQRSIQSKLWFFQWSCTMWKLGHKEDWTPKNWCFWIVVLEKILESPLDYKEIKPVNPKGNQPGIFFGRTNTETESPILQPPDVKNWLIWKDPDAGKDWRPKEKKTAENEMVR